MNQGFIQVITAKPEDRRDLFLAAANRLGTTLQNVEKDFWVCWALDWLFNGREAGEPRLLFKGGTSLSKAYGLISRFSEDIDITVFREDLGQEIALAELEKMSGKQQRKHLEAIMLACRTYIQGPLRERLAKQMQAAMGQAGMAGKDLFVDADPDDPAGQSLLVRYPSVGGPAGDYVPASVKIEAGAKSALDPHRLADIQPYVAQEFSGNLTVPGVVTIDAERTFWDKVVILHGLRRWYETRGEFRHQGHRVSRHYYDVHQLLRSPAGRKAEADHALALDCARHARMFFNSKDMDLEHARPGSFALTLTPVSAMTDALRRDYQSMASMIFGPVPAFAEVLDAIQGLEKRVNR